MISQQTIDRSLGRCSNTSPAHKKSIMIEIKHDFERMLKT